MKQPINIKTDDGFITANPQPNKVFVCSSADMHPYECGGECIHCKKEVLINHNPNECWLCCDGDPKTN